eukprot:scaffold596702_cov21-Prasinocladus_malaysianus.AAC.1
MAVSSYHRMKSGGNRVRSASTSTNSVRLSEPMLVQTPDRTVREVATRTSTQEPHLWTLHSTRRAVPLPVAINPR